MPYLQAQATGPQTVSNCKQLGCLGPAADSPLWALSGAGQRLDSPRGQASDRKAQVRPNTQPSRGSRCFRGQAGTGTFPPLQRDTARGGRASRLALLRPGPLRAGPPAPAVDADPTAPGCGQTIPRTARRDLTRPVPSAASLYRLCDRVPTQAPGLRCLHPKGRRRRRPRSPAQRSGPFPQPLHDPEEPREMRLARVPS